MPKLAIGSLCFVTPWNQVRPRRLKRLLHMSLHLPNFSPHLYSADVLDMLPIRQLLIFLTQRLNELRHMFKHPAFVIRAAATSSNIEAETAISASSCVGEEVNINNRMSTLTKS